MDRKGIGQPCFVKQTGIKGTELLASNEIANRSVTLDRWRTPADLRSSTHRLPQHTKR